MKHLSPKEERLIEDNFRNTEEAWILLDLINSEFQSDPISTQCFDSSIVERIKFCIARREYFKKNSILG